MKSGVTSLGELTSIFTDQQIINEKKERKQIKIDSFETEVVLDPLFKKVRALKKVLGKFSNKTYTEVEENSLNEYEI